MDKSRFKEVPVTARVTWSNTFRVKVLGYSLGAVFVQDDLQRGDQLLGADALLAAQGVQLLVQVGHLHAGLREVTQLLGQVRQQVLQVRGGRGGLAVAAHRHHLPELVVQGGVDGADGVFTAEEGLTACRETQNKPWLIFYL